MKTLIYILGALCLFIAPFIGATSQWTALELVTGDGSYIFWQLRFPRVLLGFLAGAGLGCAGLSYQALFRNPLASPYTFGIASAASFGAALSIALGLSSTFIGGIIGAAIITAFVLAVSYRSVSSTQMLLAGVALSFFFSSFLLLIQYTSNFTQSFQIVRWLMGGLETSSYLDPLIILPFVAFAGGLTLKRSLELDAIAMGDELALSRGVDVRAVRLQLFFSSSLLVGVIVSVCGPIGFVGIMVPHFCRLLLGPAHGELSAPALFLSGAFLVACDAFARSIIAPAELPVGILTALLGGPFFILVLLLNRR